MRAFVRAGKRADGRAGVWRAWVRAWVGEWVGGGACGFAFRHLRFEIFDTYPNIYIDIQSLISSDV